MVSFVLAICGEPGGRRDGREAGCREVAKAGCPQLAKAGCHAKSRQDVAVRLFVHRKTVSLLPLSPLGCSETASDRPAQRRFIDQSGRRGSNPRQPAWKAGTLPTELLPHHKSQFERGNLFQVGVRGLEPRTSWSQTMRATNCATPRYSAPPALTTRAL